MKKSVFLLFIPLMLGVFSGCVQKKVANETAANPDSVKIRNVQPDATNAESIPDNETIIISPFNKNAMKVTYLGGDYKGNYVWGGAMNLAWNELNENILHDKLQLNTTNKTALNMVESLNNPVFTKNDLDEASYYVKSGYGQKTVDLINKECKQKFPTKSFEDLDLDLADKDIISYAYFLKEVEYQAAFEKKTVMFDGKMVEGFFASKDAQKRNMRVWLYENENKFIVSIGLKNKKDQLFLAKGFDMSQPNQVLKALADVNTNATTIMNESDIFQAPMLHLSHNRKYEELLRIPLKNKGFESYFISEMFENIKFDMDEKGARVENEAVIVATKGALKEPSNPRKLILDKSYWVIMKRSASANPYFILGVKNTVMMKEVKN